MGWAFKSANTDEWTFGATEGYGLSPIQPAGADTHTWSNVGTRWGMFSSLEDVYVNGSGVVYHPAGYYTRYRCKTVPNANETSARSTAAQTGKTGYNFVSNNCLTKAVAILNAYGAKLPSGDWSLPNRYFESLTGWDAIAPMPTLLQVSAALNDPINTTQPINIHPAHTQRPLRVRVFDSRNAQVRDITATATQRPGTGNYTANVDLGTLAGGYYQIRVRLDYTLERLTQGITTIIASRPNYPPVTPVTVGDINQDGVVNINDYNLLMRCYSDLTPPKGPCDSSLKRASDLNDDGSVNGLDYNLYLRVVQSQRGA